MRLTRDGNLIRTDPWREGKYLDLWSVPHLLSGIVVGLSLFFLHFSTSAALMIAFLLLVGYEMFEVIAKIEETRWNRSLDVVVGMVSCVPTFLIAPLLSRDEILSAFAVILIADCILSFLGWRESQKAASLEAKLRAEITRERERFILRRAAMRKNWEDRRVKWRTRHQHNTPSPEL